LTKSVIEARRLGMRFGDAVAVDDVDLDVREGELFGLIGRNGAGKTTLVRLMLGLLRPSSGDIRVFGVPVGSAPFRAVRRRIGYLPESVALYENLTGLETLRFFAKLKGADPDQCIAMLERVGLADAATRVVGTYSKGMKQRLAFAQALLGQPRVLVLDEPTNGLDPQAVTEFYATLRELNEAGVTAILSSHVLAEVQQRVGRLALMNGGRIVGLGTVDALREQSRLPLAITIRLRNGAEGLLRRALPSDLSLHVDGSTVTLQCDRTRKMSVLESLAAMGSHLVDIRVDEPSLEQVFLGYTQGEP
jgi:Cu-processing system ATP-binding protein